MPCDNQLGDDTVALDALKGPVDAGGSVKLSFKVGCFLTAIWPSHSQGGIGFEISISEQNFSTNTDSSELITPPRRYLTGIIDKVSHTFCIWYYAKLPQRQRT